MRVSQTLLATLKEIPADAELISQQLMLRAGMIRKVAAGLYTWLPLGLRVLRKVEQIVRDEMNRAGAVEILMPAIQPAELWEETQRWDKFGPQLLKMQDRHQRNFCFGPTHEEVVTDLMRKELKSYKQLPINCYQIAMKFRDEIRPRFGVMRAREFLMKDAYSFHLDAESLEETYLAMYQAYSNICTRIGLRYRAVEADTGSIGGRASHEFHVLANAGEDLLAVSDESQYAANIEFAPALPPSEPRLAPTQACIKAATPDVTTIGEVCDFFDMQPNQVLKTLLVKGREVPLVALCLCGDHQLNEIKAAKHPLVASPLTFASAEEIALAINAPACFIGPMQLSIPVIVDFSALHMSNFVCGANEKDAHYQYVNWGRDLPEPTDTADLRNVMPGDPSPDGQGRLQLTRGIEVGHIFQLGTAYSAAMGASVLDESGRPTVLEMGCYGVGVSRIVAACIEQHHDDKGIIWPQSIAPYTVIITPVGMSRSTRLRDVCEQLYQQCIQAQLDVLFDDRDERPGVMFAEADLIGIPHRVVVSERNLDKGVVEYKARTSDEIEMIEIAQLIPRLQEKLATWGAVTRQGAVA